MCYIHQTFWFVEVLLLLYFLWPKSTINLLLWSKIYILWSSMDMCLLYPFMWNDEFYLEVKIYIKETFHSKDVILASFINCIQFHKDAMLLIILYKGFIVSLLNFQYWILMIIYLKHTPKLLIKLCSYLKTMSVLSYNSFVVL